MLIFMVLTNRPTNKYHQYNFDDVDNDETEDTKSLHWLNCLPYGMGRVRVTPYSQFGENENEVEECQNDQSGHDLR